MHSEIDRERRLVKSFYCSPLTGPLHLQRGPRPASEHIPGILDMECSRLRILLLNLFWIGTENVAVVISLTWIG